MHFEGTISLGAVAIVVTLFITVGGATWGIMSILSKILAKQAIQAEWIRKHDEFTLQQNAAFIEFGKELKAMAKDVSYLRGFADGREPKLKEQY